ncbi:hypothetical protein ACLKA7_013295 [Drosophila subpalustris]
MTSFSSAGALMPLDDYYDHCVLPKPNIPKSYPGFSGNTKKKREAAHLQSYKDNDDADEDDDDEIDEDEVERQHVDEFNTSIQDSNMNQIDFETNEFNVLYDEANDVTDTGEQNSTRAVTETPAGSAQWRIEPNNMNRPPGAAPLVPINAPRSRFQAGAARASRGIQRRRYNNNNYNRNNPQYSIKDRIGYKFPMRNACNPFKNNNNTNNNNNHGNMQQQQVLMNMNNQFQNQFQQGQPQINLSTQLNPMQQPQINLSTQLIPSLNRPNNMIGHPFTNYINQNQNDTISNNFVSSNTLTSLINAANQIRNNNNTFTRLGPPPPRTHLDNMQFGNQVQPHCNSQLQRVSNNNGIVCSDSLRLADLMNMDKNSCKNLNVAEVAKNAMLLLSSVYHKPILDQNVQQELSQLQQNNGLPEEPNGVDMQISPESTDLRLYHRFK